MPAPFDSFTETVPGEQLLAAMTNAHDDTLALALGGGVLSDGTGPVVPVVTLHAETEAARDATVAARDEVRDVLVPQAQEARDLVAQSLGSAASDPSLGVPLAADAAGRVPIAVLPGGRIEMPAGLGPLARAAEFAANPANAVVGSALLDPAMGMPLISVGGRIVASVTPTGKLEFHGGLGPQTLLALAIALGGGGGGVTGYDLVVYAGQSNNTDAYGDAALAPVPPPGSAYIWQAGNWAEMGGTKGSYSAFAAAYVARKGRGVLLVPAAVSGSTIATWQPGAANYVAAKTLIDAALALPRTLAEFGVDRVAAVSWLQGESDDTLTEAQYRTAFDAFVAGLRGSYGVGLRMLVALVGTASTAQVRAAQRAHCQADPYSHVAAAGLEGYTARGLSDGLHFNAQGLWRIGAMVADAAATTPNLNL